MEWMILQWISNVFKSVVSKIKVIENNTEMTTETWIYYCILLDNSIILKLNFLHVIISHGYEEECCCFRMYTLKYLGIKGHDFCP